MRKIFLIPGLGADTRIYNNIDLNEHDITCVDWIPPHETDTLSTYAQQLVYHYNIASNCIIIGNSMGGMIAVEIAKILPVEKVILISSIKTVDESPWYFALFRWLPVYKFIPGQLFSKMDFLIKPMFGHMGAEDSWLFGDMLKKSNPVFLKWAMGAILTWDNKTIPPRIFHITGDKDLIFNYKRIHGAEIIKDGTHIMIFDKAKEVNKILKRILKK